jgi:hypothetical protein
VTAAAGPGALAAALGLALGAAASVQPAAAAPPTPAAVEVPPVLRIAEGSVARRQVVAIGQDLEIAGEALADVVALDGSIVVGGRVAGDVIVLGGDVRLGPAGRVVGDVFVLGGAVAAAPGSVIEGRTVSYPTLSRAWVTLLEGPSLGLPPTSPLVVGAKLALLAGWLALALALFATAGREILHTSESVGQDPFRNFLIGFTAVLALVLTALFLTSLGGSLVALPMLFLVALLALLLKLWGMVAVFHALGAWLAHRLLRQRLLPLTTATVGLVLLGAFKLLPWVGVWTWTVATLIGVGAALSTKFGRREPWLVS